jgi:hypothetical protein
MQIRLKTPAKVIINDRFKYIGQKMQEGILSWRTGTAVD